MALVYSGGGFGGSLPNIPARDLGDEEVKQFGGEAALLATGLYGKPESSGKPKTENKSGRGSFSADNPKEGEP